jgi:hypothetical protein
MLSDVIMENLIALENSVHAYTRVLTWVSTGDPHGASRLGRSGEFKKELEKKRN